MDAGDGREMNGAAETEPCFARDTVAALRSLAFPLEELARHPVSAIEPVAVGVGSDHPRGVCAVRCFGCCAAAAAVPSGPPETGITRLTPRLFGRILAFAKELARENLHILSTVRLTLYNASNELDNPDCVELRSILNNYFEDVHGFPLGAVSSDLAFHLSSTPLLFHNLRDLLRLPHLWDNICFSIDEQLPLRDARDYADYLDRLRAVWQMLAPALTASLDHARPERLGAPRVILNMLVPEEGSVFASRYRELYPGGPLRALRYSELIGRYVDPFVGSLIEIRSGLPPGHRFTSGIARLSRVPGSAVYVACNRYAPTGRGSALVRFGNGSQNPVPRAINTKLYPAGQHRFRFRACFTTAPFADDEVNVSPADQPRWFAKLNGEVIDIVSRH